MPPNRTLIAMNIPGPCFFRFPTTGMWAQGPRNLRCTSRARSPPPSMPDMVSDNVAAGSNNEVDGGSKFVNSEDRARAVHLVETAIEIVRMNGDELRRCMDNLRNTI